MLEDAEDWVLDEDDESPEPLDLTSDERKLVTQPYDYSISQLKGDVENKKILLIEVPYQRQYVWDDGKASRLIESLLLNVPIPVCYFAENKDGTWEVIDGLQRTHTIVRFLNGEFALRGLSVLTELNGLTFNKLPLRDQRRVETRTIRCVVITEDSHPDIKFDVFERLNTGSVKLLPQELRNCIYRGAFNDGLRATAAGKDFRTLVGGRRDPRMRDAEMVLRFLALYDGLATYKEPLTQFLNEYMRRNRGSKPKVAALRVFSQTVHTLNSTLASHAFHLVKDGSEVQTLNRAVFDAVMIGLAYSDRDQIQKRSKQFRQAHIELMSNDEFGRLVGRATADRNRMHGRIRMYSEMIKSIGVKTALPPLPGD